jgi:hypothetical protein
MWAITSYFNPARFKRRLSNYRIFRANLGVPLVTVELSFDGVFELTEKDADILIRISGGAVLWQKERLLNVAIKSVPHSINSIAWIDCDVIFERSEWFDEAEKQLTSFNIIQLYSDLIDLNPDDAQTNYHTAPTRGHGIVSVVGEHTAGNLDLAPLLTDASRAVAPGHAWAARRDILEEHGLYDAMIVGGGDSVFIAASYGQFETAIKFCQFDGARRQHFLEWARPYHKAIGGRIGYVAGRLYHLWHGSIENRAYTDRQQRLASLNFEPDADLAIGPNGAWQWARSRPELEKFLVSYFNHRAEDGE